MGKTQTTSAGTEFRVAGDGIVLEKTVYAGEWSHIEEVEIPLSAGELFELLLAIEGTE